MQTSPQSYSKINKGMPLKAMPTNRPMTTPKTRQRTSSGTMVRALTKAGIKGRPQSTYGLPRLRDIGEHGKHHINCVYADENTSVITDEDELALLLSTVYNHDFEHPIMGSFKSIENLIWYLRTEKELLRSKNPSRVAIAARSYLKDQDDETLSLITARNLTLLVADAYWHILQKDRDFRELLLESTLPFDIWYVNARQQMVRPRSAEWQCRIFENLRKCEFEYGDYVNMGPIFLNDPVTGETEEIVWGTKRYQEAVNEIARKQMAPMMANPDASSLD